MAAIKANLEKLAETAGYIGSCVVDYNSGMMLEAHGGAGSIDLALAAAGNTEVVRSKMKIMEALGLNDTIEDILITLGRQYHLIRPLAKHQGFFIYLVIDKKNANLAMSRLHLSAVEATMELF